MKKKILFIINDMINGGGQRSLINLLELMDCQEYDIDLLLFKEKGDFFSIIPQYVKIVKTENKLESLYLNDLKALLDMNALRLNVIHIFGTILSKIISKSGYNKGQIRWKYFYKNTIPEMKQEYDIAVSYLEGEALYYLVDKVRAKRKISFIHTDYSKINPDSFFDAEYFNKVNWVIGISKKCVEILQEEFPNLKDKILLLPNLISEKAILNQAEMFYPNEYKGVPNTILLSVGRLTELKGFDMAIESAALLRNKDISFKWFIIGEGELKEELQKQIKRLNLTEYVEILGVRNNPYPYMKNAAIIVQTSKYEGKSMVLDEAKILSVPIVVTNYETVRDQINDREGIVVDMNSQSISEGIMEMMNNMLIYKQYLSAHNYGNEQEISMYYKIFGGTNENTCNT